MPTAKRNDHSSAAQGRLIASLSAATAVPPNGDEALPPGLHPLGAATQRDGWLYVPANYSAAQPAPLIVMLHGAGGNASGGLLSLLPLADAAGLLLLAPDSRDARRQTWDMLLDGYGPDVAFLDKELSCICERYAVDAKHLAIAGFSDGASYALSLGLTNGDLFTHILAFSPGFMQPAAERGKPHIYMSHGSEDTVLPIRLCSRLIAPSLLRAGYDVRYVEFPGPHTVPPSIAQEAVDWFLSTSE